MSNLDLVIYKLGKRLENKHGGCGINRHQTTIQIFPQYHHSISQDKELLQEIYNMAIEDAAKAVKLKLIDTFVCGFKATVIGEDSILDLKL